MPRKQRNPKFLAAAFVATSALAISYKLYDYFCSSKDDESNLAKKYTNKSIVLTLSHSILSSPLPLNDILLNSDNVTFILPPNISVNDLEYNIQSVNPDFQPKSLTNNYKVLNCSNFQGYFSILKNLKPDLLLLCSDDLGLHSDFPKDLHRFVKEIVNIDQNYDDITSKIQPILIN